MAFGNSNGPDITMASHGCLFLTPIKTPVLPLFTAHKPRLFSLLFFSHLSIKYVLIIHLPATQGSGRASLT